MSEYGTARPSARTAGFQGSLVRGPRSVTVHVPTGLRFHETRQAAEPDDFPFWSTLHAQDDRIAGKLERDLVRLWQDAQDAVDLAALTGALAMDAGPDTIRDILGWDDATERIDALVRDALVDAFTTGAMTPGIIPAAGITSDRIDDPARQAAEIGERSGSPRRRGMYDPVDIGLTFDKIIPGAFSYVDFQMRSQQFPDWSEFAHIQDLLRRSLRGELTVDQVARLLSGVLMMDERQVRAMEQFAANLLALNLPYDQYYDRLGKQQRRYIRQRAERIARTETMAAQNFGVMHSWDLAFKDGLMDRDRARVVWIITPDDRLCRHCSQMTGERAEVPFNQQFDTPLGPMRRPPMHPMCRCTVGLTFVDDDELDALRDDPFADQDDLNLGGARDWRGSYKGGKSYVAELDEAFDAIDRVHRVPRPLPDDPRQATQFRYEAQSSPGAAYGHINYLVDAKGTLSEIWVNTSTKYGQDRDGRISTLWHEFGHLIHHVFLTTGTDAFPNYAGLWHLKSGRAMNKPDMTGVLRAISASESYKGLMATRAKLGQPEYAGSQFNGARNYGDYLTSDLELFARAYSQYIALRTGHAGAMAALQGKSSGDWPKQWTDDDFAPIADAFDEMFRNLGWME